MEQFFKGLQLLGVVSDWSVKALADRKVTIKEAADLAEKVCDVLGIETDIQIPD